MENEEQTHFEGSSYQALCEHVQKLSENQNTIVLKLEILSKNVDDLREVLTDFSDKIVSLDDEAADAKNLKFEVQNLKSRLDELYEMVAESKVEKESSRSDEKDGADSVRSGLSTTVTMTTGLDRDTIRSAYEDVRNDASPTEWAVFKFEGPRIVCSARGSDFTEFRTHFDDGERAFGYLRLQMGDEMSKRKKFIFMTWVGPAVSVINRAKMSTDKAIIKDIISNFAVELQLESQAEIDIDQFKDALIRAGGANYGTGIRDL
ncbi:hypothetical protein JYU34_014923 [Plutella xylostella]|uniref:ADF-H domain-containing protein n=1 Tax=Plutella xylostella TaxID=51655 RepID=A0ABQ7Q5Z6_PLUXY|nr:hypothetical protein JYU34_014923 [Plutella xylostella]